MEKKDIAGGIREMRAVAKRLTTWADGMEAWLNNNPSYSEQEAARQAVPVPTAADNADPMPADPVPADEPQVSAAPTTTRRRSARNSAAKQAAAEPETFLVPEDNSAAPAPAAPSETPPPKNPSSPTMAEVRVLLADLCSSGYRDQVKALIASYGAKSLKDVPPGSYDEVMAAARGLAIGEEVKKDA